MASVPGLLEHTKAKAKGIDVCASDSSIYIIRSDLGCYMRVDDYLDKPQKLTICPINPFCAGGDHYMNDGKMFYIIRGNSFISVSDLSFPMDNVVHVKSLHQSCCNGDHYLYTNNSFYVIFEESDTYIAVSDLSTGETTEPSGKIDDENRGIYYFGTPPNLYTTPFGVVHQADKWGVAFTLINSLTQEGHSYILLPDIINFFPGGLSTTFGPTESSWKIVQSFTNTSKAELKWSKSIKKTVGYNKKHFQSMENSWSISSTVSMGTKFEAGLDFLGKASLETQFSLTASAGGKSIRSEQEDWNEQYTTEEKVEIDIPPGGSVYIWQFTLGLKGSGDVLFCRDLQLTNSADPPKDIPLPKVKDNEQ